MMGPPPYIHKRAYCSAHPIDGTVIAEVTAVLALPDGVLGPSAADLTEGAVGV